MHLPQKAAISPETWAAYSLTIACLYAQCASILKASGNYGCLYVHHCHGRLLGCNVWPMLPYGMLNFGGVCPSPMSHEHTPFLLIVSL